MPIVVETGSGAANSNAYTSQNAFEAYADDRGYDYSTYSGDQIEQSIIRGTAWIDATYRNRFPGVRSNGSTQGLLWPRKAGSIQYGQFVADAYLTTVVDAEGLVIAVDAIPAALVRATAEAAWRELQSPGSLAPDLERGGAISSIKAGSVSIDYANTAPASTTFAVIDGLLAGILTSAQSSGFTARAVRA